MLILTNQTTKTLDLIKTISFVNEFTKIRILITNKSRKNTGVPEIFQRIFIKLIDILDYGNITQASIDKSIDILNKAKPYDFRRWEKPFLR